MDANKTGFMTDDAWDANIEAFCIAMRKMDPVIEANPGWWIEYHIDGFNAKVNTIIAQETMKKYRILGVKSQSHTSHVNQSFDDAPGVALKLVLVSLIPGRRGSEERRGGHSTSRTGGTDDQREFGTAARTC